MDALSSVRTSTPTQTPAAPAPAPAPQASASTESAPQDHVDISPAALRYLAQDPAPPAMPALPRMSETGPQKPAGGGNVLAGLASSLPGYLGDCVKSKGIAIPGFTGASLEPRFDNGGVGGGPTGANFTLRL